MARTISLLCSLGDMTIAWQAENDATILPLLQQMIDKGVRFHILKKTKEIAVTKLTQAVDARKVVIPDESLQALFAQGLLAVGGLLSMESTGEIAKTPEAVVENDTLAIQQVAGG
jgi:hypothetical protein